MTRLIGASSDRRLVRADERQVASERSPAALVRRMDAATPAFVAGARREAADEDVVCRPEVIGGRPELSLYTPGGRFVESMNLPADRIPVRAEEMRRLIESIVQMVKNTPGR